VILFAISCSGAREVQKRDNLGRVSAVSYYDGNALIRTEEFSYYGNSHNPWAIIYKKKNGLELKPYREEEYVFSNNNLERISFYVYRRGEKEKAGMIRYFYKSERTDRIEYYTYRKELQEFVIFGLEQHFYNGNEMTSRRIIEFEFNGQTQKSMQIGQYVVYYEKGSISWMHSWIMNKKSKKIVEKKEFNSDLISNKVAFIEDFYMQRSRGK